jgi:predicted phosphodiesterase
MFAKRCFQYFSDLHLEKRTSLPRIQQVADTLLLAGDIGHPNTEIYQEFFNVCSLKYENIFVVDGNHEWDKGKPDPKRFQHLSNVFLLDNSHVILDKWIITGTTLWTETTQKQKHNKAVNYLTQMIDTNPDKRIIVLTHHLPSWELITLSYRKKCSTQTLSRYANHLDYLFHKPNAPWLWVCGHSHCRLEKRLGHTQCVINTFGEKYPTLKC